MPAAFFGVGRERTGMSDFDEEAERERLREKYEQEEDDRETTERMSELLLKGATMTNAHCGTCGDPIFRYDGQEFCPTCQEVVTGEDAAEGEAAEDDPAETDESATDASTGPEPTENGTTPEDAAQPPAERSANGEETVDTETTSPEGASDLPERRERAKVPDRDRQPVEPPRRPDPPARREDVEERQTGQQRSPVSGDLSEARESLRRSLVRFAREAERAEDPRRASEHLEAAHEAAEALAALSEIR